MMGAQYAIKAAEELAAGDTLSVWWGRKAATITGFREHSNGAGWRVAEFGDGFSMTLSPAMRNKVILGAKN